MVKFEIVWLEIRNEMDGALHWMVGFVMKYIFQWDGVYIFQTFFGGLKFLEIIHFSFKWKNNVTFFFYNFFFKNKVTWNFNYIMAAMLRNISLSEKIIC